MDMALRGLLIKEWRMMKGFLIGKYVVAIMILFTVSSLHEGLIGLLAASFIIVPATVLFSLNTEINQRQIFLHNPQSAHKLLLAKLLYSVVSAIVFLLIVSISLTIYEYVLGNQFITSFTALIAICFQGIVISLYLYTIVLFAWTIHQMWRRYFGSGISIVLMGFTFVAVSNVMTYLTSLPVVESFTQWGIKPIISGSQNGIELGFFTSNPLGFYLFYGIIAFLLYLISVYLIDNKLEA